MFVACIGATAAPARKDNRLSVAFLVPAESTVAGQLVPALDQLTKNINNQGGYFNAFTACVLDAPAGSKVTYRCANTAAQDVLVTTTIGDPDATTKQYPVSLIAGSLADQHQTGKLTFSLSTIDAASLTSQFKALTLEQMTDLLGRPSLDNGSLTLSSFSPFLQLVPETATDRKYIDLVEDALARQHIQFVPSQFTGLDTSVAGSGSQNDVCKNSPRYLHYQVVIRQRYEPLQAMTILYADANGQIIDCANPAAPLSFAHSSRASVISSKATIASIIGILTLSFVSHSNSWGNVAAVGNGIGGLIDTDPGSLAVEQRLYHKTVDGLINNMCDAVAKANAASKPSEAASAFPAQGQNSGVKAFDARIPGQGSTSGTPLTATTPLGIGNQTVPTEPSLVCANFKESGG
ncbi:MAG: hypothetical protein IAI49_17005 [Candidatus Eremiobacteraeota bacterium]|nr:hypothetical protein [Candidatus Eremiobacteraeota bacterium]